MNKTVKKCWNAVTSILVICAALLAILLSGVKLLGLDTYIVLSGSMEPAYPTGSMIYVKDADIDELKAGDVITFKLSGDTVATHRIIEVKEEDGERFFKTKGDANDVEDGGMLNEKSVIGTPVLMIPYLGFLASYLQSKSGFYMMIAFGAALFLLIVIPELFSEEEKGNNEHSAR